MPIRELEGLACTMGRPILNAGDDDVKLHCILDFERSWNQRQGSEFFLEKWNS